SSMYMATSSGSYAVITWNAAGCSATSASSNLTVNAIPEATIDPSGDVAICEGASQMYMANSGDLTYQWTQDGNWINGETSSMYMATSSGSYAVITWNAAGCSATSSSSNLTVNVIPEATIDPSGDVATCAGTNQLFTANSGDLTYQWTWNGNSINGATNSSYEAGTEGSYAVIVWNSNGCSATSSSSSLTINPLPEVSLGSDTTVCDTSNFVHDAGSGFESYLWNDNTTGQTHEVSESGNYSVQVTDANGCVGSSSVNVTVTTCTGIPTLSLENAVEIFPNPNFGTFVVDINMPRENHVTIDLINLVGQVVLPIYDGQMNGQFSKDVDAHSLAKAVYYLQMRFANKVITKKVVISD
ncbi:MAG: T9SS type A sorting domain-containing protein, partial [Chitinophagales bacterium]